MATIEVHPREGGADAQMFAAELTDAIGKFISQPVVTVGNVLTVHCL